MTYAGGGAIAAPPEVDQSREERVDSTRDEDHDERPERTWPRKLVVALVVVVLLAVGAFFGVGYLLGNSWYVGVNEEGFVTIYEGIPEEIAGLNLSEEIEVTDIRASQLPDFLGDNLSNGIKKDSLEDARTQITNLESQVEDNEQRRERNRQRDRNSTNDNAED